MNNPEVEKYRTMLPQRISVAIESEDGGYWAEITTEDGSLSNCYTQADSILELIPMISDAVQTHYEIPEDIRDQVGFYLPLSENHLKWETMFNQLASMQEDSKETSFTLRSSELEVAR